MSDMTAGQLLVKLRTERGLTAEDLAKISGVPLETVRTHEQGTQWISEKSREAYCRALGVPGETFGRCRGPGVGWQMGD